MIVLKFLLRKTGAQRHVEFHRQNCRFSFLSCVSLTIAKLKWRFYCLLSIILLHNCISTETFLQKIDRLSSYCLFSQYYLSFCPRQPTISLKYKLTQFFSLCSLTKIWGYKLDISATEQRKKSCYLDYFPHSLAFFPSHSIKNSSLNR